MRISWKKYRGKVDVVHGGPPCQPFSTSGRQNGSKDVRDMVPEFVRAIKEISPKAFLMENVPGLNTSKFKDYLDKTLYLPLIQEYEIHKFFIDAASFGVPQVRKRLVFIGISKKVQCNKYTPPTPTHSYSHFSDKQLMLLDLPSRKKCMGVREALGLTDIGYDNIAPTMRSTFTGPRGTTSILSSTSAQNTWRKLGIWPNGVQKEPLVAANYPAKNGHTRLAVQDCALIQGFPSNWSFTLPVSKTLGLIGNSVVPVVAYNLACSIEEALSQN
ncbi:DNA cytosine methyltransferase [Candidatus Margulisiibacteriota bacterium]